MKWRFLLENYILVKQKLLDKVIFFNFLRMKYY